MKSRLKIVNNKTQLKKLVRYCKQTGYCTFDFETTSTEYYKESEYPTVLSVTFQPGSSWVIPLGHKESKFKNEYIEVLQYFGKHVLEDARITKIAWNLQFELHWCYRYNIFPKGRLIDAMIGKYLLDETRPNDLKSMVNKFIPEFANYDDEITELVKGYGWANIPLYPLCKYAGIDSDMEMRLWLKFEPLLIEKGLYPLFRNLMMMGLRVLAESSYHGININVKRLKELKVEYDDEVEELEDKMNNYPRFRKYFKKKQKEIKKNYIADLKYEIDGMKKEMEKSNDTRVINSLKRKITNREAKISSFALGVNLTKKEEGLLEPFNFGSQTQLKDLFFENKHGFKFPIIKYTEDKWGNPTDNPSTAEDVLLKLKEIDKTGFINLMLDYRGVKHIRSNFIESYLEKVHGNKLHPSFLLHGTVSGRLSSRNPNGQQVPRITTNPHIKPLFIPSHGKLIIQMDYSQAELRVMAALAKEEEMLRWFAEGRDIHLASACKKYGFDYDKALAILINADDKENETWVKRRKQAKTINFGIIYGQGAAHLSESLSSPGNRVSKAKAQKFLDEFFSDFPKVRNYIKKQHKLADRQGYVTSPFGRKRRLPEIYSDSWAKKAEAQRQSVNAVIQGCASDYTLFASVLIWEKIKSGELPEGMVQLLTVHDSLIFELYPEDVHKVIKIIKPIAENPETKKWFGFELQGITMKVDFEIGNSWGTLKNYDENFDYSTIVNTDTINI
jgi:DNA polymerase I-like protein with 3'-5' exonuclease and polymerase domains